MSDWIEKRLGQLGIDVRQSKHNSEMNHYLELLREEIRITERFLSEDGQPPTMDAPTIWKPSNVYPSAKLGKRVSVGMFSEIGNNVIVGDLTRIGKGSFIPEGVTIGKDCFIGPHCCFTNDRFPPSPNWEKTIVEDNAAIGAGVTVLCGVVIGTSSIIGCGSVVTKSVPPHEIWAGVPAKKLRNR